MYVVDLCTCCALVLRAMSIGKVVDKGPVPWDPFALSETSELANLNPHKLMVNALFARHGRSRRPTNFHLDA
jgi:hypothetical protein